MNRLTLLLVLFLLLIGHEAVAAKLESIVIKQRKGVTMVFCSFSGPVTYKSFILRQPERIVIDFPQTTAAINARNLPLGNGLVQSVRTGHPNINTLRLVFDVKNTANLRTKPWQPPNHQKFGLQIDLLSKAGTATPIAHHHNATTINIINTQHARRVPLRDVVVVLDPGHGGKDPGAIGPRHHAEKEVVLAIALKLKQLIDNQPGMHAVLTRNGDYFVGLRERLTIARRHNADIFVSIHADAFANQQSTGASVFALSQTGATSEAARWLAEKENYSELGGVNLSGLDDRNGAIRTVLLDLSQTATISASLQMGRFVLRHMDKITSLHHSAVEQARFVVLKSPDIPSVLIETGFITNPKEENNLSNSSYQARLTRAIFEGINRYFWDNPPHGTRLETMASARLHIVKAGEVLPTIAKRYHISVAALKDQNHLSHQDIKPGQRLMIPSSWK